MGGNGGDLLEGGGIVAIFLLAVAFAASVIAIRGTYLLTWEALRNLPNVQRESGGGTEPHGPKDPGDSGGIEPMAPGPVQPGHKPPPGVR